MCQGHPRSSKVADLVWPYVTRFARFRDEVDWEWCNPFRRQFTRFGRFYSERSQTPVTLLVRFPVFDLTSEFTCWPSTLKFGITGLLTSRTAYLFFSVLAPSRGERLVFTPFTLASPTRKTLTNYERVRAKIALIVDHCPLHTAYIDIKYGSHNGKRI